MAAAEAIAVAHRPVMLAEVVAALAPRDGAVVVDATFGAGGYARALLAAVRCRVIGIDRDARAIAAGAALARDHGDRLTLVQGRFGEMVRLLAEHGITRLDGVVMDLGVSSMQLDEPARGFSFRRDGPLDMRMGSTGETAADVVNTYPEDRLAEIVRNLGEERHARRVAAAIVAARRRAPIRRTGALAAIVRAVVPAAADGIDPATRTFQALRIRINDELGEIDRGLAAAERLLVPGGRLAVVAFHSLEDRRVKRFLGLRSGHAPRPSRHAPEAVRPAPSLTLLQRRVLRPSAAEVAANPRARSARLRAAVRSDAPAWERAS